MKKLITLLFTATGLMFATLAPAQRIIVKTPEYPPEPTAKTNADSTRELETCAACNGSGKDIRDNPCEICQGCGQLVACRIKEMFGYKLLQKLKAPKEINNAVVEVEIRPNIRKRLKYFTKYEALVDKEGYIRILRAEGTMKSEDEAKALFLKYKKDYEKLGFKVIEEKDKNNGRPILLIVDETRLMSLTLHSAEDHTLRDVRFSYQFNQMSHRITERLNKERLEKAASKL